MSERSEGRPSGPAGGEGAERTSEPVGPPDEERVEARAGAIPEEAAVGADDPDEQARAILEDSDVRQSDRDAAPGKVVEHRTSEDTVEPPA
jgi:hypothetical protein